LFYQLTVLMVCVITLGYWLAVFPTDLVLPDNVQKPDVDWSLPEEERGITELE